MKKIKLSSFNNKRHIFTGLLVVACVGIAGALVVSISHAGNPFVDVAASSGQVASPATIGSSSSASNGHFVQFGSAASSSTCSSPFTDSYFCQPVTGDAVLSNSAAMVSNFVSQYKNNYGTININNGSYGDPIYRVGANQPTSNVSFNTSACSGHASFQTMSVPVPSGATSATGTDHSIIFYQPSTNSDWEFWEFTNTNGVYQACAGGKISPVNTSNGVFPVSATQSQVASSGISYLATDITETDVQSGAINHALAVQIIYCNGSYVAPARSNYDCGNNGNTSNDIPYGQYFRFPSSLALPSGLTPLGQMIFKAIQKYGMVVTDKSGAVAISAETPVGWQLTGNSGDPITSAMNGVASYSVITGLPWSQLQAIAPPALP